MFNKVNNTYYDFNFNELGHPYETCVARLWWCMYDIDYIAVL